MRPFKSMSPSEMFWIDEATFVPEQLVNKARQPLTWNDITGLTDSVQQFVEVMKREIAVAAAFPNEPFHTTAVFYGPPGVGKTLLSDVLAREANQPIIMVDAIRIGSSSWKGEAQARLVALGSVIKKLAPCVVLVDELDRIGEDSVKNSFLQLLSGAKLNDKRPFTFIATTNNPELFSDALWDRFTHHVEFKPSTIEQRTSMLTLALQSVPSGRAGPDGVMHPLVTDAQKGQIVAKTKSGRQIDAIVNELEKLHQRPLPKGTFEYIVDNATMQKPAINNFWLAL